MKDSKQWRCKNNHILGFISWNGSGLPQLMILREALDMEAEHPKDVDLIGPLSGSMPVRCSICDDVKVWSISVDGLVALFMQLDDKTVFEFSQRLLEMSEKVLDLDDPANPAPDPLRLRRVPPNAGLDTREEQVRATRPPTHLGEEEHGKENV